MIYLIYLLIISNIKNITCYEDNDSHDSTGDIISKSLLYGFIIFMIFCSCWCCYCIFPSSRKYFKYLVITMSVIFGIAFIIIIIISFAQAI